MRWASEAGAGKRLCLEGRAAARSERKEIILIRRNLFQKL